MRTLAVIALAGLMWPFAAGAQTCPPRPQETVRAAEAIDGDTLRLEDGRIVRLVSVLAPKAEPGARADAARRLADTARSALAEAVVGRDLGLAITGQKQDRHGRFLAHAFVDSDPDRWLQRDIVAKGLAWAYALEDNYRCVGSLLDAEAGARAARVGLWATDLGAIADGGRPRQLSGRTGRFAIVEGRVVSVGERPRRTYLNFGTNWSEDFTVYVDRGDRARFDTADIALKGLAGRRVRVRGWILDDRGPAIHMTNPEQLEIVDAR